MKSKNNTVFNGIMMMAPVAMLILNFQNCSNSSHFTQAASTAPDTVVTPEVVQATPKVEDFDKSAAQITLRGVVRDGWRTHTSLSSAPIAGVTIHLKSGSRFDAATKNKPDIATIKTDSSGVFVFANLPYGADGKYTFYWDVPAHYYHESDYAFEVEISKLNEDRDISDGIWITSHGVAYRCMYSDYLPMKNLSVKYYKAQSGTKMGSVVKTTVTNIYGDFYIDTAELSGDGSGGLAELSDSNGNVVGRVHFSQFNHQGLTGGGICDRN